MPEIRVDVDIVYNAKVESFMKKTGTSRAEAIGHLVILWAWCAVYAVEGVLPKLTDWEIAGVCKRRSDAKEFVDALIECGFLDRGTDSLTVHDWRRWLPPAVKKKLKRLDNVQSNGRTVDGQTAGQTPDTGESLSLPSVKPLGKTKTTTETNKPSVKSPHVEYVDRFKAFYESKVGHSFKYGRAQFVLAAKLIKDHGLEAVIARTMILAKMCADRSMWFTKNGWGDFSIEKLSNQWNSIIGEAIVDEKAELREGLRKAREQRERADHIMGR